MTEFETAVKKAKEMVGITEEEAKANEEKAKSVLCNKSGNVENKLDSLMHDMIVLRAQTSEIIKAMNSNFKYISDQIKKIEEKIGKHNSK